jgi:flavin-binding protein dodecin
MPDHIYKHIELTGSSKTSIEDAIQNAVVKANESVRNMRWFQMIDLRGHLDNGKVSHWQVTIKIGFTLED